MPGHSCEHWNTIIFTLKLLAWPCHDPVLIAVATECYVNLGQMDFFYILYNNICFSQSLVCPMKPQIAEQEPRDCFGD